VLGWQLRRREAAGEHGLLIENSARLALTRSLTATGAWGTGQSRRLDNNTERGRYISLTDKGGGKRRAGINHYSRRSFKIAAFGVAFEIAYLSTTLTHPPRKTLSRRAFFDLAPPNAL
jgi:hypothetical protein